MTCARAAMAAAALALALPAAASAQRPVFTVSPAGDDGSPGTAEQPWRTIAHAARSVPPGAIVDIRGGTYRERIVVQVSGTAEAPITFRAHEGERVVVSGSRVRRLSDLAGLLHIDGAAHLEFEGIVLRDLADSARRPRFTPAGVVVTGESHHVTLRRLEVTAISTRRGDAHGIAVYGTEREPIRAVAIEDSSVHDLRLGSSEAVVINGNVDGWHVTGNTIDDVNNIGIDAIGFEGTAPVDDRARNGLIARNVISDVDTRGNFAYETDDGNCRCAGGIYVDGGQGIVIERNRVTRANLGIELASEHRRGATSDVIVRSNVVTASDRAGFTAGGYDTKRGRTERVHVVNNTFVGNDRARDGVGEFELNFDIRDSTFVNNVIVAGKQGILVSNWFRQNSGNRFDGNVWHARKIAPDRARWQWRRKRARGFEAWRRLTGFDAAGRFADPLLAADGRPGAGSPAIDAGIGSDLAGDVDFSGAPRRQGAALDAGAFEAG